MTRCAASFTLSLLAVACVTGVVAGATRQARPTPAKQDAAVPVRNDPELEIGFDPLFLVGHRPTSQNQLFRTYNQAEIVFAATVRDAAAGFFNPSFPPIHNLRLKFTGVQVLRGVVPRDAVFHYSKRQHEGPRFPRRRVLVAAGRYFPTGPPRIIWIVEASPQNHRLVSSALALPPGWTQRAEKPISPWARLGTNAWPLDRPGAAPASTPVCSVSRRPAFPAGKGIRLQVEPVAPPVRKPSENSQGDGRFKVTVANTGTEAAEVPALRTDGRQILWSDSLYVLSQWKPYLLPGARTRKQTQAVRLGPGARVSTVVDLLAIPEIPWLGEGPVEEWGHNLYFQFCLGELSRTQGFYYDHLHHSGRREQLLPGLPIPRGSSRK
ncbi:MAG TPA: hypothetical protein VK689_13030 [Armatimonadota bacterium]|nr:hypothetical protein [Armatimonadota bacterium]